MIGKGFAYLGLPPLFIGEIALLAGFVVVLRTGCLVAALATLPSLVLAATMIWVLLRTLPYVGAYGFDALRDSVVIMYGGFAFVIIALLLEDGRRINSMLRSFGAFLSIYGPTIPFIYALHHYMANYVPNWPGYNVPVLEIRSGEIAVHLTGAALFVLVGFRKVSSLWILFVLAGMMMASVSSRGALLAIVLPIIFAVLVLGKLRELALVIVVGLAIFATAYAVETTFRDRREARASSERSLSAQQIVDNVVSIVGQGGEQTEGTKTWRLEWWNIILANTMFGPNFWTGRGFGLNLADADGFRDGDHPDLPALRSPHNVHMTMLARAGVPGAALWLGFLTSWFAMMMHAMLTARRHGQTEWAGLFLFASCYAASFVINASFDVALEGPMQGIWFWCLIGFGIGTTMIYRYMQDNCLWKARLGRQLLPARARRGLPPA
ncbi:O-antigen ligase family protein [Bradyrhizobium lablabi]|nr:O-antigen ligase family protein [Bradyrhizobium lablabi]